MEPFKIGDEVVAVYNPNLVGIVTQRLLHSAIIEYANSSGIIFVVSIHYDNLRHTKKQKFNNDFEDKLNGS